MTVRAPTRENSRNQLSKAHAIVYKAVPRAEVAESSYVFRLLNVNQ